MEISVSTRPDCVSAEYLDIMRDIRAMTGIQMNVELGLQTANYHTLHDRQGDMVLQNLSMQYCGLKDILVFQSVPM